MDHLRLDWIKPAASLNGSVQTLGRVHSTPEIGQQAEASMTPLETLAEMKTMKTRSIKLLKSCATLLILITKRLCIPIWMEKVAMAREVAAVQ